MITTLKDILELIWMCYLMIFFDDNKKIFDTINFLCFVENLLLNI